jgi:hypothetical protein
VLKARGAALDKGGAGAGGPQNGVIGPGGVFVDPKEARKAQERQAATNAVIDGNGVPIVQPPWRMGRLPGALRSSLVPEVRRIRIDAGATVAATKNSSGGGGGGEPGSYTTKVTTNKKRGAAGDGERSDAPSAQKGPMPEAPATPPPLKTKVPPPTAGAGKKITGVKKDFFGRIIPDKKPALPDPAIPSTPSKSADGPTNTATSGSPAKGMSKAAASRVALAESAAKYRVRYVFSDGATNAIKKDAVMSDFV